MTAIFAGAHENGVEIEIDAGQQAADPLEGHKADHADEDRPDHGGDEALPGVLVG